MQVFHGTTNLAASQIIVEQNFKIHNASATHPTIMINDLGNGIYAYCDDVDMLWNPKNNAYKYASIYKNKQSKQFNVVAIEVDLTGASLLDFDKHANFIMIIKIIEKLQYRVGRIFDNIPDSGSKRRHNVDGIAIELAIEKQMLPNVDIIIKKTYTAFKLNTISNFQNGREFVIRNPHVIKSIKKQY